MTTREYFQARLDKAERELCNATTPEERTAAYDRRDTARLQVQMCDND